MKIPSKIFYDYVDFMWGRINKGMDVAEEAIWDGATECLFRTTKANSKHKIEPEIERNVIGETISKFMDKYRSALRYGILDSAPDIDVLLLAKELDAAVVASDMGIQKWAEQLGLRFVNTKSFPAMIKKCFSCHIADHRSHPFAGENCAGCHGKAGCMDCHKEPHAPFMGVPKIASKEQFNDYASTRKVH